MKEKDYMIHKLEQERENDKKLIQDSKKLEREN